MNLDGRADIREHPLFCVNVGYFFPLISCLMNTIFKICWLLGTMISLATTRTFRVGVFLFPATNDLMTNLSGQLKAL
jgi:hypothetical protein